MTEIQPTLIARPTAIGGEKLRNDYLVLDESRKTIGRIMLHPMSPQGRQWFWSITARFPQSMHDRGYAESREQAMADFKASWLRKPVTVRRSIK